MEWLQNNWQALVVLVIAVIAFIIWIIYLTYKKGLKQVAIDFIVWAENALSTEEGKVKFDAVCDKIIALVPMPISLFLTRHAIEKLVQSVFDSIKEALDNVPAGYVRISEDCDCPSCSCDKEGE